MQIYGGTITDDQCADIFKHLAGTFLPCDVTSSLIKRHGEYLVAVSKRPGNRIRLHRINLYVVSAHRLIRSWTCRGLLRKRGVWLYKRNGRPSKASKH